MKKIFSLIIGLILIFLAGCSGENLSSTSKEGRIPVYQGMTITETNQSSSSLSAKNTKRSKDNVWYSGDSKDKENNEEDNDSFPDHDNVKDVEDVIESSLKVVGTSKEIYYACANEDIYINIHISNPDNYEILSFTLNEKKYSSYMFEPGSDMETLILKYNVGNTSGIQEYTIDAIKYVDGTEIKDVVMDGNRTVTAGVKTENQVSAQILDSIISTNEISLNIEINDKDDLVKYSNGCFEIVLYDGKTIINTTKLEVGKNEVKFENLKTNTVYQYAVLGHYDDLSGDGLAIHLLYDQFISTKAVVLFNNIQIGYEEIEFNFEWNNDFENKEIETLTLIKDNQNIKLDNQTTKVEGLLSNTVYSLVAEYLNGSQIETISIEFKTAAKATPVVEIKDVVATQDSVKFDINVTDEDKVGSITKVELYQGETLVKTLDNHENLEFTNLLSNNEYEIKVTYAYDLNDGIGNQDIVVKESIRTLSKATPVVEIKDVVATQDSVKFDINVTDEDKVGSIAKVELYQGETLVKTLDNHEELEFSSLDFYTEYMIMVNYVYDLCDGLELQSKIVYYSFKTLPKFEINSVVVLNTDVIFEDSIIYVQINFDNLYKF
jgi:hypothetical protein